MKQDKTVESAIFDSRLLDMGEWAPTEKEKFEAWTKIYKFDDKRLEASKTLSYLIPHLLEDDCTAVCRKYSRRLAEKLILFEDLLYTTRGGLAKKFYRDHLNHMLRTALLARAIAKHVKCLGFADEEVKLLSIAALTHDISYPLAEASKMISDTVSAIEDCYQSLKFVQSPPHLNIEGILELFENLLPKSASLNAVQLASLFENHNHGLMSALEFLFYVKDRGKFSKVIEAIALHDSDLRTPVNLSEKKILGTLILSDEMQDWGRPVHFEEEPTVAEIKNFKLGANCILGDFDLSTESRLSPFRQIFAKVKNLSRMDLIETGLKIRISFSLPKYAKLDFSRFEDLLQKLYNSHPKMITIPEGFSEEMFLESYYGARLSSDDKGKIIKSLSQNSLLKDSPFIESSLYLNESRLEVINTQRDLGELQQATIQNENGSLIFEMKGKSGTLKGLLLSQRDGIGLEFCKRIAAAMFLFDSILADIRSVQIVPIGLYLTAGDVKTILTQEKIAFDNELIDNVASIHRCLQNGGFFYFKAIS